MQPIGTQARCDELIRELKLEPLPVESGLFRVERISDLGVTADGAEFSAANAIYYLLNRDHPQNHLHQLYSDDHHILIEGGPADYYVFTPDGGSHHYTLGSNQQQGEVPMVVARAGSAKAIRLRPEACYMLVGSVVTPAWKPNQVRHGLNREFLDTYCDSSEWATATFLKSLTPIHDLEETS